MRSKPIIGICGAGIGGLSALIALKRIGFDAEIFEQASVFARVGADISLTPIPSGLQAYQEARLERTAQIQWGSRSNEWLKAGGRADWVSGYDAWGVSIGLSV